ncbi:MAG: hypothetical protein PVJ67_00145 [Candidatus Pacearchaeota archaeon]
MVGSAVKWLFDDYLKISKELIPAYATVKLFRDVGFWGILAKRFNSSPYAAVNKAYPGEFGKEDFNTRRKIICLPKRNFAKQ